MGWFTQVRKARNAARLARAYEGLFDVIDLARNVTVLPFSRAAVGRYVDLKTTLPRAGKHDLAIAAVALEFNATVVTRNRQDFERVPGLRIEDWSVPTSYRECAAVPEKSARSTACGARYAAPFEQDST